MDRFWQVLFVVDGLSPSGRLVVKRLSEMGHRVYYGACPSVNAETVDAPLATALPLKLGDDNSVAHAATTLLKAERRIDTVVNNKRRPLFGALEMVSPAKVEDYLNETMVGMVRLQNSFLPAMRAQNSGRFVTIAPRGRLSSTSFRGWQRAVNVAERALTETLIHELGGTNIEVSLIEVPLLDRGKEWPPNDLDRDLHAQVMPSSWNSFLLHIQALFQETPSVEAQAEQILDALIPTDPPKKSAKNPLFTELNKASSVLLRPWRK